MVFIHLKVAFIYINLRTKMPFLYKLKFVGSPMFSPDRHLRKMSTKGFRAVSRKLATLQKISKTLFIVN